MAKCKVCKQIEIEENKNACDKCIHIYEEVTQAIVEVKNENKR